MLKRLITFSILVMLFMFAAGIGTYLTVHLLIRSENVVVVPDLEGKDVVYALEILSDLKLNTKVKESEYSPTVPKHHVIAQDPEPGTEMKQGRDVRLVISKGAQAVVLPNLIGMSVPQARIFLAENDLSVGHLSHAYDAMRPREEILAQVPLPGTISLRGNKINLLVSTGPVPITVSMADLKGLTLNQAIEAIESHHLVPGHIRTVRDLSMADNTVVTHNPTSGYPVAIGSAVDVTINQHTRPEKGRQQNGVALFRHRSPSGFLKQHVRVNVIRPAATIEMFNGFVRPGREVWLLIPYDHPITVLLYLDDELAATNRFE